MHQRRLWKPRRTRNPSASRHIRGLCKSTMAWRTSRMARIGCLGLLGMLQCASALHNLHALPAAARWPHLPRWGPEQAVHALRVPYDDDLEVVRRNSSFRNDMTVVGEGSGVVDVGGDVGVAAAAAAVGASFKMPRVADALSAAGREEASAGDLERSAGFCGSIDGCITIGASRAVAA